jgi:hypothetical protein
MDDKQRDDILRVVSSYIMPWFDGKRTGNYSVTIEAVINQGGIRDIYFSTTAREKKTV